MHISYSFFKISGHSWGSKCPQGVFGGVGENVFLLKDALYLDNSNDTSFSSIGPCDGKLFNFLKFFDIFLGGVKRAPREESRGWVKNIFSLKDARHLENSNNTSFSSIGHRDGKLFNF